MNKIKFSKNWGNKLNNPAFTTIRKWTEQKEKYYTDNLRRRCQILLDQMVFCHGRLMAVKKIQFKHIQHDLLVRDTGYSEQKDIDKIFSNFGIGPDTWVLILVIEKDLNHEAD